MYKKNISEDRKKYLRKNLLKKIGIIFTQISILIVFIAGWEMAANKGIIDSFIMSQPSEILETFINLSSNDLLMHIQVTCTETIIGFLLGTGIGIIIAILLWWSDFLNKALEPYLVILNSLPKVALRTSYNHMGWSWYSCDYYNGYSNFISCNYIRCFKWFSRNR